jgi:hypothetical protein
MQFLEGGNSMTKLIFAFCFLHCERNPYEYYRIRMASLTPSNQPYIPTQIPKPEASRIPNGSLVLGYYITCRFSSTRSSVDLWLLPLDNSSPCIVLTSLPLPLSLSISIVWPTCTLIFPSGYPAPSLTTPLGPQSILCISSSSSSLPLTAEICVVTVGWLLEE